MKKNYIKVIVLSLIMSCIMIVPQIIKGDGMLSIYADFNFQQVPFAMSAIEEIHNGNLSYTWINDIGTSFIGTYGYYNLASPFFLIALLFPSTWYPYLVGPLLILKLVIASLLAYIFLERYIKNKNYAISGALLYTFSGFQITNLLFHFQDVIALFPLLLIALDKAMYEDKKGLFVIAVALNAMTNYFFFVGQVVFLGLYFLIKWFTKEYKLTWKKFIQLAIESILGVSLAAFIFIPSIIFVLGNPRVDNAWTIANAILPKDYQLVEIFRGLVLPPEIMSERSLFQPYLFTSSELYLPFIGMVLFTSYMWKKKKSWISILLLTSFIFMTIPILNSTFFAFTTTYYARWFYMPILIMALASMKAIEENAKLEHGYLATALTFVAFIFITLVFSLKDNQVVYHFSYLLINILLGLFGYIGLYIIFKFKNNKKIFERLLLIGIIISVSLQSFVFFYKYNSIENPNEYKNYLNNNLKFDYIKDGERTDSSSNVRENLSYILNIPNLKNFNTSISGNAFTFYNSLNLNRTVRTDIGEQHPKLRDFLSVKYFINNKDEVADLNIKEETENYTVYENDNYISMGIPYKYYITKEKFLTLTPENREDILIYAVILDEQQVKKYKDNLKELDLSQLDKLNKQYTEHIENISNKTSSKFSYTNKGANLTINSEKEEFYVLTIPYDKGWNIKINGEEASFENVDNGLIGINLTSGENKIIMEYKAKGLTSGILISILSLLSYFIYLIINKKKLEN